MTRGPTRTQRTELREETFLPRCGWVSERAVDGRPARLETSREVTTTGASHVTPVWSGVSTEMGPSLSTMAC